MAERPPSLGWLVFFVVVVVIVAGVGAALLYKYNTVKGAAGPLTVAVGDNVTVNYIGLFGSGPEQGKVFDTSLQRVALDGAAYPKSLEYSARNTSQYTPLAVHVGPNTPSSGYNVSGVTYLGVVPGFWRGLVGLAVNQSRWVSVPPDLGYGSLDPACLRTASLNETIPTVVTVPLSSFATEYPGDLGLTGATFADPTYGWTDEVLSANATAVVVERMPYVGETTDPYGWTIEVVKVTSASLTLLSELTPSSVGVVLGSISGVTVCSTTSFLVWSVNLSGGTFTENYNREVVGETLIFVVTIVSILPP